MTTIITRLYPDAATADAVVKDLLADGHASDTIDIIPAGAGVAALRAARVGTAAARAYAEAMTGGRTLVVVRAPFAPMGTARNAIRVVNRRASIDVGLASQDEYIRERPGPMVSNNILTDHPLVMSNPYSRPWHGRIFGRGVIESRPRSSAMRGGGHVSTRFWPMKLITTGRSTTSARRTGWQLSKLFGLPTIIPR
jgi:hypothetical protein